MRTLLVALLLASLALAGCSGDESPSDDCVVHEHDGIEESHGDCPPDDGAPQGAPDDSNVTNQAPSALLTGDVLNGTAPLKVNFTITVSDADGDNLTWTFNPGGNSTVEGFEASALLNFTYTVAGNYTATLTVSDGLNTTVASLQITVAPAADPVPQGPCGGEPEPCVVDSNTWVNFWSDGSCRMKSQYIQFSTGSLIYINDRHTGTAGTGLVAGGGTWIYEETNGQAGMWVHKDEGGAYGGCLNGDTIIF